MHCPATKLLNRKRKETKNFEHYCAVGKNQKLSQGLNNHIFKLWFKRTKQRHSFLKNVGTHNKIHKQQQQQSPGDYFLQKSQAQQRTRIH